MTFQKVVLIVATVILIIFLVILAIILAKSKNNFQYPPELGGCPDYFKITEKNGEHVCKNVKHLGSGGSCDMKNFSGMSVKDKRVWSKECGVTWDGITNV
tara:strand:- start:1736 stop:2035 length:300 start_codon:yes stop_codon:yes gene_type:complete